MGWKNWPYWLKGGLIGLAILVLLSIITPTGAQIGMIIIAALLGFGVENVGSLALLIMFYIILMIPFFLIGALISYIIGKIKSRKGKE